MATVDAAETGCGLVVAAKARQVAANAEKRRGHRTGRRPSVSNKVSIETPASILKSMSCERMCLATVVAEEWTHPDVAEAYGVTMVLQAQSAHIGIRRCVTTNISMARRAQALLAMV